MPPYLIPHFHCLLLHIPFTVIHISHIAILTSRRQLFLRSSELLRTKPIPIVNPFAVAFRGAWEGPEGLFDHVKGGFFHGEFEIFFEGGIAEHDAGEVGGFRVHSGM